MIRQDRIELAQAKMREQGIDAYMILTHDDYIYFFGEDRYQPRAVLPARGEPIIITFQGELDEVKANMQLQNVKVFATVGQQIKDVVESMKSLFQAASGKDNMTVGVQMGFFTPAFMLNMFKKANPQVEVVSIAPVMDDLRMVKEASKIELIKKACEIADIGMSTAQRCLKVGVSENEVGAEIEYAMRKAGGHGVATPVFVNSGVRSGWMHGMASEKIVEASDLVVVDIVPRYRGYCANLCRTFVVGQASEKQAHMH